MAATDAGRRLTEAHRLAQIRVQAETVLQLSRAWPALDPTNLSRTWPPVERFATALVADRRARSADLAASYLDRFVQAEAGGRLANAPALMSAINVEQVRTSLQVTGPVAIKNATARGVSVAKAAQVALATVGASAGRHVANGGRETLLATALNEGFDRWSRISDGRPCGFCAMLVSRGPVYLSAGSGGFQAHDHCGCTAEIVVSGDGWTEQARQFRDEWDDATRGETDALAAWRRHVDGGSQQSGGLVTFDPDKPGASGLTAAAETALRDYQGVWYHDINAPLRQGATLEPRPAEIVAELDDVIAGSVTDSDVTVFRGIQDRPVGLQVGGQFTDQGFVSTSFDEDYVRRMFVDVEASEGAALMRIRVPSGTNGVRMESPAGLGQSFQESELLLGRDQRFRVVGVTPGDPDQFIPPVFDVELIP
jgi:hypothetical protein